MYVMLHLLNIIKRFHSFLFRTHEVSNVQAIKRLLSSMSGETCLKDTLQWADIDYEH